MKITVVVENTACRPELRGEHGLSLWVETPPARVLFDTGQGGALPHNAIALGIPLEAADAIVLSHGHYDHTGGLACAMDRAPRARVYAHPAALGSRFSVRESGTRNIAMPDSARSALDDAATRVTWTPRPTDVAPGLHVTGSIPRRNTFEDVGGPFFLDREGSEPDVLPDDQALWLETDRGPVVILGCAHAGVINTLDYVAELSGARRIHAVIGGMHLAGASEERLRATVAALVKYNVQQIAPCHCTGAAAVSFLRDHLGERVAPCSAGAVVDLP